MLKYIEIILICIFSALIFNLFLYYLFIAFITALEIDLNINILVDNPVFYIAFGQSLKLGVSSGVLLWKIIRQKDKLEKYVIYISNTISITLIIFCLICAVLKL